LRAGLWFDLRVGHDTNVMLAVASRSAFQALLTLLPLFGLLVVTAIFASVVLGGFLFSTKALEPKFERLSPLKGIKRMFSAQTAVELLKTLAKASVIGLIAVLVISHYKDQMIALMHATPSEALTSGMGLVALCCALIVSGLSLIVMIDAPWQLFSHYKKMRMSRQDVKQEHKESDGDPHVKGRIRQQQRAMARRRMMAEVPHADVVVTNPTHYAVALAYQDGQGGAPRVVAKGSGLIAARIRSVASEHKVPMLSAPPLARALHHHVELGREIPIELYSAVAEVLAWVYQLRNWNMGVGTPPEKPAKLIVPPGFDPAGQQGVATRSS
jgi:flagellar biosynthetic protein FlhB